MRHLKISELARVWEYGQAFAPAANYGSQHHGRSCRIFIAAGPAACVRSRLLAQDNVGAPTRPIRFVVPFAPGGSSEIARALGSGECPKALGQNGFVETSRARPATIDDAEVGRAPTTSTSSSSGPHRHAGSEQRSCTRSLPYDRTMTQAGEPVAKVRAGTSSFARDGEQPQGVRSVCRRSRASSTTAPRQLAARATSHSST